MRMQTVQINLAMGSYTGPWSSHIPPLVMFSLDQMYSTPGIQTLLVILLATTLPSAFQPFCFKLSKNFVEYIYCGYYWIYTA